MTKLSDEQLVTTIFDTGLLRPGEAKKMGLPGANLFFNAMKDWLEENPVEVLQDPEVVEQIRAQFKAFLSGSAIGTGGYGSRVRAGKAKKDATGST
jgi:hypothetical protein